MQVIEHPVGRLHTALLSTRKDLIEAYQQFSRADKTLLEEGLKPGNSLFSPITIHSDSDWIPAHPEDPQNFQSFYSNPYRKSPCSGHKTIYIQTIGSFGEGGVVAEQFVEWLKDYCQAFYYGLVVKLLPPVTVALTACTFRINSNTHNLQLHAGELLDFLKKRKSKDAFCIMGITMIDLYPKESWNFVFGQASLTEGDIKLWSCDFLVNLITPPKNENYVIIYSPLLTLCVEQNKEIYTVLEQLKGMGIFSFARYDDHFYERNYAGRLNKTTKTKQGDYSVFQNYYTPPITSTLLLRSCKTVTHEIGHIFGVKHCQWLQCVMQGSNHLEESDRRPLDLCPICLRKIQSSIGFKIAERYKALLHWIEDGDDSTGQHSAKPTQAFQEYRRWLYECLKILEDKSL